MLRVQLLGCGKKSLSPDHKQHSAQTISDDQRQLKGYLGVETSSYQEMVKWEEQQQDMLLPTL